MTLIEFQVDLARVADSLEKIVFLLEKLVFPPPPADVPVRQATLDDLQTVAPEDVERIRQEKVDFSARYGVMPDSEAMAQALEQWEDEQRSIYGEDWQAPEDWRAILAHAQRREGNARESVGASGQTAERR